MRCLLLGIALLGCDKSGSSASGKLESTESSLLTQLPASGDLVFGGNLMSFQSELAKSPLSKLTKMAEMAPGMGAWQDCLVAQKPEKMLGTVDASNGISLRYVMTKIGIPELEKCAKAGNFKFKTDPDGKFISITMPGLDDASMGFLALPDGVYGRQSFDFTGLAPSVHKLHRASFEADREVAKKDNAGGNNRLVSTMELADRSKSMWFAGSATKTPFADKVKDIYGFIDLAGGVHVDVTVQLMDAETADQIMRSVDQGRDAAGFLGKEVKKVLDAIDVRRDGTQLRVTIKVSNKDLESLIETLGPMMNMGLGLGGGRGRQQPLRRPTLPERDPQ